MNSHDQPFPVTACDESTYAASAIADLSDELTRFVGELEDDLRSGRMVSCEKAQTARRLRERAERLFSDVG